MPSEWLIVTLYFSVLAAMGLWGLHRMILLSWLTHPGPLKQHAKPEEPWKPTVLVQLPIFNEPRVVQRIIDAVAQLDWPRLEIQVLDDSTDDTVALAAARVAYWRASGLDIRHIQRPGRAGFKAGALSHGLKHSTAEFVAIFDADFIPTADFLKRMMPELQAENVGMVQARWGHINRDENWLTRVQAMLLDGHFVIEHTARFRAGCFFNFNGTAGIWRKSAIIDAGGWAHDTITEDLDLSYRAQLKGWRFVYREDVVAPAELPTTMGAFLTQQHRWAKGTVQTAAKLVGPIAKAPLPLKVRLEAINHLCMVAAYPLVFMLALLLPLSIVAREAIFNNGLLWLDIGAVVATTGSICWFYAATLKHAGQSIAQRWWEIPLAMALGVGCSVSQSLAVFEGLFSDDATFVRTPKRGDGQPWVTQIKLGRWLATSVMALYYLGAFTWVAYTGRWESLLFVGLLGTGFILVSLAQSKAVGRVEEAAALDMAPATK